MLTGTFAARTNTDYIDRPGANLGQACAGCDRVSIPTAPFIGVESGSNPGKAGFAQARSSARGSEQHPVKDTSPFNSFIHSDCHVPLQLARNDEPDTLRATYVYMLMVETCGQAATGGLMGMRTSGPIVTSLPMVSAGGQR